MSWWQTAPILIAACAVFFLPGLTVARSIGLKGLPMWATAPAITVSLAAVSAVAAGMAGIGWNSISLLTATGITVLIAFGIRATWRRKANPEKLQDTPTATWSSTWVITAAVIVGLGGAAFILAFRLVHMFGAPDNISQTYDNIFHLNAVRYAFDTGAASSLLISGMTSAETAPTFYPAAWHDMVVLLMQLTGASIPVAVNVCNIIVSALMWPLAAMFLASRVLGNHPIPLVAAGALSTGFAAFPYLMLDFGVLYPYALSLAILPVALGLVASLTRLDATGPPRSWVAATALVGVIPGMVLAHPSSLVSLMGMAAPIVLFALLRLGSALRRRGGSPARFLVPAAGIVAYAALLYAAWALLRPLREASFWGPVESQAQSIGEVLTSAPLGRPIAWVIFLSTVLGVMVCARRPDYRWVLGSFLVAGALFVVAAAAPIGDLRWSVVGVWYSDPNRLASLLPIPTVAIASVGCTVFVRWVIDRFKAWPAVPAALDPDGPKSGVAGVTALAILSAVGLSWLVQGENITVAQARGNQSYAMWEGSPLLSTDERALLERVDEHVADDATIVGSPWTGASLVYAFSDRKALTPFVYGELSESATSLLHELNQDTPVSLSICNDAEALNSYYVLDFGSQEVHGGDHALGPENIDTRDGLELVDSEGEAKLFRISTCG